MGGMPPLARVRRLEIYEVCVGLQFVDARCRCRGAGASFVVAGTVGRRGQSTSDDASPSARKHSWVDCTGEELQCRGSRSWVQVRSRGEHDYTRLAGRDNGRGEIGRGGRGRGRMRGGARLGRPESAAWLTTSIQGTGKIQYWSGKLPGTLSW